MNRWCVIVILILFGSSFSSFADINEDFLKAANLGRIAEVQKLLDAGADVNIQDKEGFTALMLSAWYGSTEVYTQTVQALIDASADVNARNMYGKTALMLAEEKGNTTVVDMLQKAAADKQY